MSRFSCLLLAFVCCASFTSKAGALALGAAASVAAVSAPAHGAYSVAWKRANATLLHTDAVQVAEALAQQIGLTTGPAREALEIFLDQELTQYPTTSTAPAATLATLIRQDVRGFQRALSAVLPEDAFVRYTTLRDQLLAPAQ